MFQIVTLLRALGKAFGANVRESGLWAASVRLARSSQIVLQPRQAVLALNHIALLYAELKSQDLNVLFFIQHGSYLSRHFNIRQRISSAAHHYAYLSRSHRTGFVRDVYGSRGLTLWRSAAATDEFRIVLVPGRDYRLEGDLSAVFYFNETQLGLMSFSFVDSAVFGCINPGPTIFITRNQSSSKVLQAGPFREAFKHTTPQYLILAALSGIAQAHGMQRMIAIHYEAQIARTCCPYENFVNSYGSFWRGFRAEQLRCQSYVLTVPLDLVPLSRLKAKHRRRALERRQLWTQVAADARASMAWYVDPHAQVQGLPPAEEPLGYLHSAA